MRQTVVVRDRALEEGGALKLLFGRGGTWQLVAEAVAPVPKTSAPLHFCSSTLLVYAPKIPVNFGEK